MSPTAVLAGIYARISSDREGDGLGVARQIEDCRAAGGAEGLADRGAVHRRRRQRMEREEAAAVRADLGGLGRRGDQRAAWSTTWIACTDSRASWRRSSTLCQRLRLTNVASVSGDIDLTTGGWSVPGPYPRRRWRRRRATIRAAGFGGSTKRSRRTGGCRVAAADPTGTSRTS